jgi:hypothetical protein
MHCQQTLMARKWWMTKPLYFESCWKLIMLNLSYWYDEELHKTMDAITKLTNKHGLNGFGAMGKL